jgi:hypothetical protein
VDSKLEREIHFKQHDDIDAAGEWRLYEVDEAGVQLGIDWQPSTDELTFSAKNLQLREGLGTDFQFAFDFFDVEEVAFDSEFLESSAITAELQFQPTDSKTSISLFGTGREVNSYSLHICAVKKGESEYRRVTGLPAYEGEISLEYSTDHIGIDVGLSEKRYGKLVSQVMGKPISEFRLNISLVKGLYEESTYGSSFKALCGGTKIVPSDNSETSPYRLGHQIGCLNIGFISESDMGTGEGFSSFDMLEPSERLSSLEYQQLTNSLMAKLVSSQQELLKLKLPLWVGASALCLLLIKLWV